MSILDPTTLYITEHAYRRAKERLFLTQETFTALVSASVGDWDIHTVEDMQALGAGSLSGFRYVPPFPNHILSTQEKGELFYLPWTDIQGLCFVVVEEDNEESSLCMATVWPFVYAKVMKSWRKKASKISRKLQRQVLRAGRKAQEYNADVTRTVKSKAGFIKSVGEEQVTSLRWRSREIRKWYLKEGLYL